LREKIMKTRYRLFLRRKSVYYAFDDTTKTFTSLKTKDKAEATRLLVAMNEAGKQPAMNFEPRPCLLAAQRPDGFRAHLAACSGGNHPDQNRPDTGMLEIRRQGQGVRFDPQPYPH
jgi:hypothetical protein